MARKKESVLVTERELFPSILRKLMEEENIKQEQLANAIGVTRQTISLYTNGQSSPDWKKLRAIASFFDVSSDYLLGLTEHPTPNTDERAASEYTGLSVENIRSLRVLPEEEKLSFNTFISAFPIIFLSHALSNLYSAERADAFGTLCSHYAFGLDKHPEAPNSADVVAKRLTEGLFISDVVRDKISSNSIINLSLNEQTMLSFIFSNSEKKSGPPPSLAPQDIEINLRDYFKHKTQDALSDMLDRFIEDARMTMHTKEITSLIETTVSECADKILKEGAHGET